MSSTHAPLLSEYYPFNDVQCFLGRLSFVRSVNMIPGDFCVAYAIAAALKQSMQQSNSWKGSIIDKAVIADAKVFVVSAKLLQSHYEAVLRKLVRGACQYNKCTRGSHTAIERGIPSLAK